MTRRQTRTVIITAVVLGLFSLGMVFWALTRSPDPVAEPVPHPTTAAPSTTTVVTSATPSTTTTAPPTTTTPKPPPKAPVAQPPKTTTRPAAPPATTVNSLCQAGQWQPNTAYNGGAIVLHNGAEWYARSWNYNAEPGAGAEDVWVRAISC